MSLTKTHLFLFRLPSLIIALTAAFTALPLLSHAAESANAQQKLHIRTLAASCAACHGTNGNSHSTTPVLAGLNETHFATQMHAFKNNGRASTVMHHHAKGLNTVEIEQLAKYFSQQKRVSPPPLPAQTLEARHE